MCGNVNGDVSNNGNVLCFVLFAFACEFSLHSRTEMLKMLNTVHRRLETVHCKPTIKHVKHFQAEHILHKIKVSNDHVQYVYIFTTTYGTVI